MNDYKVLSALSYFSIFFAPFLLPIIIFFASSNEDIKQHSKRAFLSHLIPIGAGIVMFILFAIGTFGFSFSEQPSGDVVFIAWIAAVAIYGIISLAVTIWNIVQGIRVLR